MPDSNERRWTAVIKAFQPSPQKPAHDQFTIAQYTQFQARFQHNFNAAVRTNFRNITHLEPVAFTNATLGKLFRMTIERYPYGMDLRAHFGWYASQSLCWEFKPFQDWLEDRRV